MIKIFDEINDFLSYSTPSIIWISSMIIIIFLLIYLYFNLTSGGSIPEQIEVLAKGRLVNIRSTGAFYTHDTELKFDDGSMLLMIYSFTRNHSLKENHDYMIWWSSIHGYCCKELKEN